MGIVPSIWVFFSSLAQRGVQNAPEAPLLRRMHCSSYDCQVRNVVDVVVGAAPLQSQNSGAFIAFPFSVKCAKYLWSTSFGPQFATIGQSAGTSVSATTLPLAGTV